MEFGIYGVSYKEADADVRDCTAFSDTQKMELYNQLLDVDITQAVILSTCNRSELYFIYEKEEQLEEAVSGGCRKGCSAVFENRRDCCLLSV